MSTLPSSIVAPVPRLSASLIVINNRNEILLVHRNPKATAFGGMHVFPGGNYDKNQDSSLAITAMRETFEESGLLLASATGTASLPSDSVLDDARKTIHQQGLSFQTFLTSNHLTPDLKSLLPFTQWITPVGPPKRFHTQFYVAFLPEAPSSGFSSGAKQERIPTHVLDGRQEVIEARFVHPKQALDECREGKVSFMPPQFYLLSTLADILQGSKNTPEQRSQVEKLSNGLFGRMIINPRPIGQDSDGRTILTYEGDETRGGSVGRLHRALLKMQGGGASQISLIRNFDVFSEIEPKAFQLFSKL
ncbi:NUDIX domain-containing protein [Panaeolus papilionaceus]|nr:NUDIX domain-containing protein [Panaeolus papilionaceus]